jgi:hypothetical protein
VKLLKSEEIIVGIPNDTVMANEAAEENRVRDGKTNRRRLEEALERGLAGTFPGSDAVSVTQPAPSAVDKKKS